MSIRSRRRALSHRSIGAVLVLVALAMATVAGVAKAADPVEVGWRDFVIGGGVNRATADKPQSKLWFTDGSWYGGLFSSASDAYRVYRFNTGTNNWSSGTGLPILDVRNATHGDYLFENNTLWVASTQNGDVTAPYSDDTIKVYRSTFNPATDSYSAPAVATIPGTQTTTAAIEGGATTVTIARDSTGRLWTTWPHSNQVRYSISDDNGTTWSAPAQLPGQVGNTIKDGQTPSADIPAVINLSGNIGIMWSDHDNLPTNADNGFYFTSIAAGADPTVGANWAAKVKLPSIAGANDGERADNHINMKVAEDGTLYAVTKTGKDTINCATNQDRPLVTLFKRTTAGVWSIHLVSTVGDCGTRPQVILSDELDVVYVALTSPNGGGAIYLKSAPMNGPEALKFRTADTTVQRGVAFIRSATETQIDDATSSKQNATSASGLLVLANNLTAGNRSYLHNRLVLAASDATDPVGTITIDGGAASTSSPARTVSVAVPATDTGSGLSQVRISNLGTTDGNGVLNGAGSITYAYATPKSWTLTAGDGLKTVYAQWRDASGNWSAVSSDTIIYDSVALVGSVTIDDGAAFTNEIGVSLDVTATDAGSGVDNVRIANVGTLDVDGVLNGAGATTSAYSTPKAWNVTAGNGTKTVYVQWQDGNGVWSAVQSDTIDLDTTDPAGTVSINGGAAKSGSSTVSVAVAATDNASGVTQVRMANSSSVDGNGVLNGAGATTSAYSTPKTWTLVAGEGSKTVYVQWQDGAGNWSAVASDAITVDASLPPFTDIDGNTFYEDIAWLADSGITQGCSPTLFCPNDEVTRGQMAAFLHRALPGLPLGTATDFIDDNGTTFEEDIEWLSAAGITQGCTPDRFCPNASVTRGQMAAFLHRALPGLPLGTATNFTDTNGTTFEEDIAWLSAAGITQGCTPTTFCPNEPVTRGQMAAFLHRALGDD